MEQEFNRWVTIAAVLKTHNELPKNDRGVASVTIRQLLNRYCPECTGIVQEYVCSFGAHGLDVLYRLVAHNATDREKEYDAKVNAMFNAMVSDLRKEGAFN